MKKYFLIRANHPVLKYENVKVYDIYLFIKLLNELLDAGYEIESVQTEYETDRKDNKAE